MIAAQRTFARSSRRALVGSCLGGAATAGVVCASTVVRSQALRTALDTVVTSSAIENSLVDFMVAVRLRKWSEEGLEARASCRLMRGAGTRRQECYRARRTESPWPQTVSADLR